MRINRLRGRFEEETEELENTLFAAKKIHEMHNEHFFGRQERPYFAQAVETINQVIEELLPDRIEASINSPEWRGIRVEIRERLENSLPEAPPPHFFYLFSDRIELLMFMQKVAQVWEEHLENPSQVVPYRGDIAVDIDSLSPVQRENLSQEMLSAAIELVRTSPEQINLARLTILENIIESFRNWYEAEPDREVPDAIEKTKEAIKLAKGLKELHNEGVFQRNAL